MKAGARKRLLIVATTTGYQTNMFREAAQRLGVDVSLATDRCHVLDDPWGDHAIPVRFEAPEESAAALARGRSFDAVVAIGDRPAYLAALAAERLGLPFHRPQAAAAAINKFATRECFRKAGLPVPAYFQVRSETKTPEWRQTGFSIRAFSNRLDYPTSRGVIRADSPQEFVRALVKDTQAFKDSRHCAAERPGLRLHSGGDVPAGARVRARRFGDRWALAHAGVIR